MRLVALVLFLLAVNAAFLAATKCPASEDLAKTQEMWKRANNIFEGGSKPVSYNSDQPVRLAQSSLDSIIERQYRRGVESATDPEVRTRREQELNKYLDYREKQRQEKRKERKRQIAVSAAVAGGSAIPLILGFFWPPAWYAGYALAAGVMGAALYDAFKKGNPGYIAFSLFIIGGMAALLTVMALASLTGTGAIILGLWGVGWGTISALWGAIKGS